MLNNTTAKFTCDPSAALVACQRIMTWPLTLVFTKMSLPVPLVLRFIHSGAIRASGMSLAAVGALSPAKSLPANCRNPEVETFTVEYEMP